MTFRGKAIFGLITGLGVWVSERYGFINLLPKPSEFLSYLNLIVELAIYLAAFIFVLALLKRKSAISPSADGLVYGFTTGFWIASQLFP